MTYTTISEKLFLLNDVSMSSYHYIKKWNVSDYKKKIDKQYQSKSKSSNDQNW